MIVFNEKDFNLTKVRFESKLANLITRFSYNIYGLKQDENPVVLIEYNYNKIDEEFEKRMNDVIKFFLSNGIEIEKSSDSEKNKIDIGLRKDLRALLNSNKKPLFAASTLTT